MESNRDAPIYRIPKASGAGNDVKKTVDSYMEFHNDANGSNLAARTEKYTEVRFYIIFFPFFYYFYLLSFIFYVYGSFLTLLCFLDDQSLL